MSRLVCREAIIPTAYLPLQANGEPDVAFTKRTGDSGKVAGSDVAGINGVEV